MRKKAFKIICFAFIMCLFFQATHAQQAPGVKPTDEADAKTKAELEKKATEWAGSLQLNDEAKTQRVKTAIATHLSLVKDWHDSHPYNMIPEGLNPTTGNKLSEMDRQIIICSTKPKSIHDDLMKALRTELDSAQ